MSNLKGIDVSHWQKGINLKNIEADFVIIKASQGTSKKDECLSSFASDILTSNKLFGVYHFADGKSSGKQEAEWFVNCIKPYIGKAILVLDWEADALKKGMPYAKEFCDTVYSLTKVMPILYCSTSVIRNGDWSVFTKVYPYVWLAEYGANKPRDGYADEKYYSSRSINGFKEIIRQYSSKTRLSGFNADLDVNFAYIDSNKFKSLYGKTNINTGNTTIKLSVHDVALKIINGEGEWKVNGEARKKKLQEEGYNPNEVQAEINKILSANKSSSSSKEVYYTVQHRDTASKIARDNGITLNQLIKLNPQIQNINILRVGQQIRVK